MYKLNDEFYFNQHADQQNLARQYSIQWRSVKWLPEKHMFRHSEIILFWPWQYPTERTMGEPPAPSMYIYMFYIFMIITPHICESDRSSKVANGSSWHLGIRFLQLLNHCLHWRIWRVKFVTMKLWESWLGWSSISWSRCEIFIFK